jgi:hypothetical protein
MKSTENPSVSLDDVQGERGAVLQWQYAWGVGMMNTGCKKKKREWSIRGRGRGFVGCGRSPVKLEGAVEVCDKAENESSGH